MAGLAGEPSSRGSSAWAATDGHPALPQPEQHAAVSENVIRWHGIPMAQYIWKKKLQHNHCLNTSPPFFPPL